LANFGTSIHNRIHQILTKMWIQITIHKFDKWYVCIYCGRLSYDFVCVFWLMDIMFLEEHSASILTATVKIEAVHSSEAVCSSDRLLSTYKITCCHNPQDHNMNLHNRETIKSQICTYCLSWNASYKFGN
jgi:hypothetical protein